MTGPDLIVSKLLISRVEDQGVKKDYCVKNIGQDSAAGFSIRFRNLDTGRNLRDVSIKTLAPNQEVCDAVTVFGVGIDGGNGYRRGKNRIQLFADHLKRVREANEENNEKVVVFDTVMTGPDLIVSKLLISRVEDQGVKKDYCVKNIGQLLANRFSIRFRNLDTGQNLRNVSIKPLAPNQEICGVVTVFGVGIDGGNGYRGGENRIQLFVDHLKRIREADEKNNEKVVVFDTTLPIVGRLRDIENQLAFISEIVRGLINNIEKFLGR